jgi:hypothetical protein
MTRRLFVCHASAEIESTSEVVDVLENALDFPAGSLLTSSLPGYSSEAHKAEALRDALSETSVVLALISENSLNDPGFHYELGAAWALGIRTVGVYLGDPAQLQLPLAWPLQALEVVTGQDPNDWASLIGDLSLRLGLVPRPAATQPPHVSTYPTPAFSELQPLAAPEPAGFTAPPPLAAPARNEADFSDLNEETAPGKRKPAFTPELPPPAYDAELPRPAFDALNAPSLDFSRSEPPPPAYDSELRPTARAEEAAAAASLDSDVYARPPSCEVGLEAGRAVSDCLFNRDQIDDFESELAHPLGRLIDSIGGSWDELRRAQDFDGWRQTTETLLRNLPSEVRYVEDWYQLGFELAILHNLAGQLVLDGSDAAAEQQWRGALERFLERAEKAEIGYENLAKVLGLLENLAGPSSQRDLANIGRSLEELRRYAAGADGIHSAA